MRRHVSRCRAGLLAGLLLPVVFPALASAQQGEAEGSGAPAEAESAPEARPLGDNTGDPPPQDALAVMGRAAESAEQFYLSAEQLEAVKENISGEARMEIFALILSKVPAEEIRTISELLEDGLHAEEAEAARFILEQYLTQEELYRLFELLQ